MRKTGMLFTVASVLLIAGCASQSQVLAQRQPDALNAAVKRAQFDLNCPDAKGEVLSSDYIQPAAQGRWGGVQGVTRLEYTVGTEGCGKREVYVVMCQEGTTSCFASESRDRSH
jgi:hypothetical protein